MAAGTLNITDQEEESAFESYAARIRNGDFSPQGQQADVEDVVGLYLLDLNLYPPDVAERRDEIQQDLEAELGPDNAAFIASFLDLFAGLPVDILTAQVNPEPRTNSPSAVGEPVNLATGQFCYSHEDFMVAGAGIDFRFVRTYKSGTLYQGPLGPNWDHAYNLWLRDDGDSVTVTTGQLAPVRYFPHDDFPYYLGLASDDIVVATADDAFEQRSPDGRVIRFEQAGGTAGTVYQVTRITDRLGNSLQFTYDAASRLSTVAVNHPGRLVRFSYDDLSRITAITLFPVTYITSSGPALIERTWTYAYDDFSDLVAVAGPATDEFPAGRTTQYAYSSPSSFAQRQHDLLRITDPNGATYLENEYGSAAGTVAFGKVVRQRVADGVFLFDYADVIADLSWSFGDADRPASCVTVVQRDGHPVRYVLNAVGNILASQETILGGGEQVVLWRYAYDADGRRTAALSPEGRVTQTYYGREDFYRRLLSPGDGSVAMWHDPQLSAAEHARFPNVIATVRRCVTLALAGLLDDLAVYGDVFPDVLAVTPGDIIVKYTYEGQFQQLATVSDPRYTSSPDPATPESQDPASSYSKHLTTTSFNSDPGATPAAVTYPDTTYPEPLPDGATGIAAARATFDAYDANGRLLRWTQPEGNVFANEYFGASAATPTTAGFLAAATAGAGVLDLRTAFDVNEAGQVVAVTDPLGHTSRLDLDACGLVRRLTLPLPGYQVACGYDGNQQIVSRQTTIIDADGSVAAGSPEVAAFAYNEAMSVVQTSFGDSSQAPLRRSQRVYDTSNRLTWLVRPRGNSISYQYNERSQLSRVTEGFCTPEAAATAYGYDLDGLCVAVTSPRGQQTTTTLDAFGRPARITDPLGNLRRTDYDKLNNATVTRSFAAQEASAYPLLRHTEYAYDERGQLIRERKAVFTAPIPTRDPVGAPDAEFAVAVQDGTIQWSDTLTYRDGNLRVFRVVDANGHAGTMQYDAANRPVAATDAAGNVTSVTYDAASNVIRRDRRLVDSGGVVRAVLSSVYEFDPLNRVTAMTDGAGNRAVLGIDSRGSRRSFTDALGHLTEYGYNGFGDQITETQILLPWPGPGTPAGLTTSRSYDANSNVLTITDPAGNTTAFTYDLLDRATRVTNPDGTSRTMAYDQDGNLTEQVDEEGVSISRTYDAVGQLTGLVVQGATGPGSAEQPARFTYDGAGTLTGHVNSILSAERNCDSLGRCYQESLTFGPSLSGPASPLTISRQFDAVSNVIGLTYPSGQTLRYEYAPDDHLVRLESTAKAGNYPGDPATPASRSVLQKQWWGDLATGAQLGNGTVIVTAYNAVGRRISDQCTLSGGDSFLLQQLWDGAGNRALAIEADAGATQGWWHGYDSTDRLVGSLSLPTPEPVATDPLAPPLVPLPVAAFQCQQAIDAIIGSFGVSPPTQPEWGYDRAGNRRSQHTSGTTVLYSANARNEYLRAGTIAFNHDRAGRLIGDDDFTFAYNFSGQLVQAVSRHSGSVVLTIFHDATGRPVGIIEGGQIRVLVPDGGSPIEAYDDGVLSALQLWESPGRLCFIAAGGTDQFIMRDVLDSTRLTSDARGAAIDVFRYDAFGQLLVGTPASPFLYSGKYLYGSIGWYEYRARQYLPALGRFAQPDPAGFADGPNLYAFVGNNPLSATDPRGTDRQSVTRAAVTEPTEKSRAGTRIPQPVPGTKEFFLANRSPRHSPTSGLAGIKARLGVPAAPAPTPEFRQFQEPLSPREREFEEFKVSIYAVWMMLKTYYETADYVTKPAQVMMVVPGALKVAGGLSLEEAAALEREAASTTWSRTANTLQDEMALQAAKEGAGETIIPELDDPRYQGMEKVSVTVKSAEGRVSDVHYVRDRAGRGTWDPGGPPGMEDFKFKRQSDDALTPFERRLDPRTGPGKPPPDFPLPPK